MLCSSNVSLNAGCSKPINTHVTYYDETNQGRYILKIYKVAYISNEGITTYVIIHNVLQFYGYYFSHR